MKTRGGFTLIEIMIVIVILGVMAAIAIPQYVGANAQARTTCLLSNLHAIRRQIELYKHHHRNLPAAEGETDADFTRRMTTRTDPNGAVGTEFGPYLERIPINVFNGLRTIRVGGPPAGTNTNGWRFDPLTGEFQADDQYDGNGDGLPDHSYL